MTIIYDHNGMRIQKTLQHDWYPETTKYTYHDEQLTHMTVDYTDWDEVAQQDKLHFFYDAEDQVAKVSFNGVIYTYLHNLQGDIVGLLDNTGTLVVEYKYDAWGRLLSTTGSLADTLGKRNPFRYRGYVYDEETELYYLRSRYYRPEWGRFINADVVENCEAEDLLSLNLFCYVCNRPLLDNDPDGTFAISLSLGLAALTAAVSKYAIAAVATVAVAVVVPLAAKAVKRAVKTVGVVVSAAVSYAAARVKERIGRRKRYNTRKKAEEAAKKAGRGKTRHDSNGHPPKVKSPHFHPDVPQPKPGKQTPHMPSPHDHYFYPKGR